MRHLRLAEWEPALEIPGDSHIIDFSLPPELEASEPPEARGLSRDEVRLMVSFIENNRLVHTRFKNLPQFLDPGDVVAINTSATMKAALPATAGDHISLELHLSTRLPGGIWVVEIRSKKESATVPFYDLTGGQELHLPGGASAIIHRPYVVENDQLPPPEPGFDIYPNGSSAKHSQRLWLASLQLPVPIQSYLQQYGSPIRYSYIKEQWPIEYYQTVYAREIGSAEMPSAGRAFTTEIITELIVRGVQVVPLLLHTGVASLEAREPPYEEYYRIPPDTARIINSARSANRRVVAIGTTVVRALETVTDADGLTHPGEGWTKEIATPERGIRSVNGLLTGFHEPKASHLAMLTALCGKEHVQIAYREALKKKYLWHEFGDLHLIFSK